MSTGNDAAGGVGGRDPVDAGLVASIGVGGVADGVVGGGERTFELAIDLAIAPGETVALLGPNGAGKSTTVDVVAGLRALDRGFVRLGERDLDRPATGSWVPPERRRIGVVFQRLWLFDHLDVLDNVAFAPMAAGAGRRAARGVASTWLDRLEVGDLGDRRPSQLSGGQAQRVALARALASEPEALLLDEPLAAIDVEGRHRLRRTIRAHLDAFHGPRLLITHDPADAMLLADRVVVIEDGRVTQTGTPEEIRRRPATPYVAALAGINLFPAVADGGALRLRDHAHELRSADTAPDGDVLVTVPPRAVAVHLEQPGGSPRNTWRTKISGVEPLGDITRILVTDPVPLGIDITPSSTDALGLRPGTEIWVSIKATEINVHAT